MCCGGRDGMRFAIKTSQKKKNGVVGREGASKRKKPTYMGNIETLQNKMFAIF